jgi:2-polyprenyl-3-methyl-5-hydroxy-6-metoxy-1,4-benzoquinol methylase
MTLIPLPSLRDRCRQPELMDQPGLELALHWRALEGLRRINAMSRTSAILWRPIAMLAAADREKDRTTRALDLATGGGAIPIVLSRRAARRGFRVTIDGCDKSPQAIEFASQEAAARGVQSRFFVLDVLNQPLPEDYDIIMCSLFLHHLDEASAISLLKRMAAAARRLVLVDDLVRSRLGYLLAYLGCRLLSGSHIVHADGPVSVAAAFTIDETCALTRKAGLRDAKLVPHWPQRFLLSWNAT